MKRGMVFLLLALIVFFGTFYVSAQTTVSNCMNISSSGETYTLNQSFTSSGTCLVINVSNIILDGANFNVTGDDGQDDLGILINGTNSVLSNITIRNITLYDFGKGVYAIGLNASIFRKVISHSANGTALEILNSNNISVINSLANNSLAGIISRGDNMTLINVTSSFNLADGLLVSNHSFNRFSIYNSTFFSNNLSGINIQNTSRDFIIRGNNISNNGLHGINGMLNASIENNVILGNNHSGITCQSFLGSTQTCSRGLIAHNSFSYNVREAIHFSDASSQRVINNTFDSNGVALLIIQQGSGTGSFNFSDITINNSKNHSIYLNGGGLDGINFTNVTILNGNQSAFDLRIGGGIDDTYFSNSYISNYSFIGSGGTIILENSFGQIRFTSDINGSGTNFTREIMIINNSGSVRSDLNMGLNRSANITLRGLLTNYTNPVILRDGAICSFCHNFTSLNAGTVVFNVSYWTNYSIGENDNVAPSITINTPQNITYTSSSIAFSVTLDKNGSVRYTLNGGINNITMETTNNINFNYTNSSIADGSYVFIAYANDSNGNNRSANVTFSIDTSSGNENSGGSGGSGGGGGGGAGATTYWLVTFPYDSKDFSEQEPYMNEFGERYRVRIKLNETIYHIGLTSLTSEKAVLNITLLPESELNFGEYLRKDLNEDGFYDVEIYYSYYNLTSLRSRLILSSIRAEVLDEETNAPNPSVNYLGDSITLFKVIYWIVVTIISATIFYLVYRVVRNFLTEKRKVKLSSIDRSKFYSA